MAAATEMAVEPTQMEEHAEDMEAEEGHSALPLELEQHGINRRHGKISVGRPHGQPSLRDAQVLCQVKGISTPRLCTKRDRFKIVPSTSRRRRRN